ncbi:MAG: asparagine synthase-related protein, partial [Actinomycetota bacterium]|nr:asparagine synthase-related protein [Actinomycetota bacterium]
KRLSHLEDVLRTSGAFATVRRPHRSWVVATAPLPGGVQEINDATRTFFAEGAHLFDRAGPAGIDHAATARDARGLASFPGDFGFVHFGGDGRAAVVRSAGGRVPLYVFDHPDVVIIATRLTELVRWCPVELQYDLMVCALSTTGWAIFPDNRTFFRGVEIVPRGHRVLIAGGKARVAERYWDARPARRVRRPTAATRREHTERFRSLLLGYLERELDDERNILTLSGGVDSSSLAALAAGVLGRPVDALSLMPRDQPYLDNERRYLDNLARELPLGRRCEFQMTVADRVDLLKRTPRVAFPIVHPALGALSDMVDGGEPAVLFGGEFADEVAGSTFTFPDWLDQTSLWSLARHPKEWPMGSRTPQAWLGHRRRSLAHRPFFPLPSEVPDWVNTDLRGEYREWRARRLAAFAADQRPWKWLDLHAEGDNFLAMNWEATTELNVRRAWPFLNRPMLELAFECHPSELVGPGIKKLLRAALPDDVPRLNLERSDRGHWPTEEAIIQPPPPAVGLEGLLADPRKWGDQAGEWPTFWKWVLAIFSTHVCELRSHGAVGWLRKLPDIGRN